MEVLSILVVFLAILQFFIPPSPSWGTPKKVITFIILLAVSFFIFSYRDSFYLEKHNAPDENVAAVVNTSSNESYNAAPQSIEQTALANPPVNPTQTPFTQSDNSSSSQPYSIYRSDKVLELKRGKHYPYICNPEIKNCLGFTMKFSYNLPEGNYVKNVWLVCVRENGDNWVQVGEITINEGEEKEFTIRFDRAISFSEIVIQRPIDYNDYMHTDNLSIYNIIYA